MLSVAFVKILMIRATQCRSNTVEVKDVRVLITAQVKHLSRPELTHMTRSKLVMEGWTVGLSNTT
jgi:hypothetical protein